MREFNTQLNITARSVIVYFEIGKAESIGTLFVISFINQIEFHVMQADILFLLCIQNMNKLRIYLNNFIDQIVLRNGFTILIVHFHEHFFLIWGSQSVNYLIDVELRQLYRRFGHPSVNRFVCILKKIEYNGPQHRQVL